MKQGFFGTETCGKLAANRQALARIQRQADGRIARHIILRRVEHNREHFRKAHQKI